MNKGLSIVLVYAFYNITIEQLHENAHIALFTDLTRRLSYEACWGPSKTCLKGRLSYDRLPCIILVL